MRPSWADTPARTTRRGHFWIAGERVEHEGKTCQRGPMFVAWEAPGTVTRPCPVVLVHGGGFQGTEWLDTPDGRPGWAQRLVEAGYATLVVDRPGHGRSPLHPAIIDPLGPPFSYEGGHQIYAPPDPSGARTQWPFDPDDRDAMDQFIAGYGPLPADLAQSEDMDADRPARLLDRIGPAIMLTHSASGPSGWLAADRRRDWKAIVSVEPMGPPFADIPSIGKPRWGLTASPLTFDPPCATPEAVRDADPAKLRLPNLAGLPVAVVTGDTSAFAPASPPIVGALKAGGAAAELLHLPDHGVTGNGHGLIYERNSDAALQPVLAWLSRHGDCAPRRGTHVNNTNTEESE